jgi:hypothetical protein
VQARPKLRLVPSTSAKLIKFVVNLIKSLTDLVKSKAEIVKSVTEFGSFVSDLTISAVQQGPYSGLAAS